MDEGKEKLMNYTVIIERDGDGFSVHFPDVPGCFSDGDTYEQAFENAKVALEEHLASLRDYGKPIPEPTTRAETIAVKAS